MDYKLLILFLLSILLVSLSTKDDIIVKTRTGSSSSDPHDNQKMIPLTTNPVLKQDLNSNLKQKKNRHRHHLQ